MRKLLPGEKASLIQEIAVSAIQVADRAARKGQQMKGRRRAVGRANGIAGGDVVVSTILLEGF